MISILVRCDASLSIGSGHVMRCRTLARELKRRGAEVIFLCRRQSGDLIDLLAQDFEVFSLPELPLTDCEGLEGRDLYEAWLGCSQAQDAADCLQVLRSAPNCNPDWLVVDHYGLDASWERQILEGQVGKAQPKLFVIDDLAERPHLSDLLLDQNFFGEATEHRYEGLLPPHCRQLLGPHYALLGPEYFQFHPLLRERREVHRLLVYFGGVDQDNLTSRTLKALRDPLLAHLAVDVVIGRQSPHRQAVEDLVSQRLFTTLHDPLPSLAGLIARADLAIGAGGSTTWERACLKVPSLVVAIAENQLPFSKALHQAGHLQLLGEAATVSVEQIRSALLAWVADPPLQGAVLDLTDGMGALRLALAILGPKTVISLRPADQGDEALLLRWANDPQFRASSFSPGLSASSDHHKWFMQGLIDPNRLLFIAVAADGCPIGQILFDRESLPTQVDSSEAMVYLSLDRCARGFGLEADLIRMGLHLMEQKWGPDIKAGAQFLTSNQSRYACFCRAGLVLEPTLSPSPPVSAYEPLALMPGRITLLSDRESWLNRSLPELIQALWKRGHAVRWIHHPDELSAGDVCLLLSFSRLLSAEQLALNRYNLVVHESALPQGQGWSPMTWQILEGSSRIPVTLFEAVAELDAGPIYLQQQIYLKGHELVDEWRALQAQATLDLCLEWFDRHQEVVVAAQPQLGEPSQFRRRRPADSQLDPDRSLTEQFNLLRVVDNQGYPAFFRMRGRTLLIHVLGENDDAQMR